MANVLILGEQGDGVPIAIKLAKEKHTVHLYVKDKKCKDLLKGFSNPILVEKPDGYRYDLIISAMVGNGALCDHLTSKGNLVVGGGAFNDRLELDRDYGSKVVEKLTKLKLPPTQRIATKQELINFLLKSKESKAIKPLGNKSVDLTLIGMRKNNSSLVSIAHLWGDKITPCIAQDLVFGLEISTEGWFNGEEWIAFNHTFEKKRLMDDDKGPQTGCMGNVVWGTESNELIERGLKPLTSLLQKANYIGPLDINCILTAKDAYFLEFTARLGYDAIQAYAEILRMPLFEFFYRLATKGPVLEPGKDYYDDAVGVAVRLSVPPYPNQKDADKWKGVQVVDMRDEGARKHTWLCDVMKPRGIEVLAGSCGVVGTCTARGQDPREALKRIYKSINNIAVNKDLQYRTDIVKDFIVNKERFERWCDGAE